MIDANEAWSSKEALIKLEAIRRAGHDLLWVEDPILRNDFDGLRMLRDAAPWTQINSGEYLDLHGQAPAARSATAPTSSTSMARSSDVMRIGWLAADMGIPVSLGNTFLEVGVHMAVALPEVEWLEYSFQNFDHLVDEPIEIRDGYAYAPDRPGHGLVLSETARARLGAADSCLPRDRTGRSARQSATWSDETNILLSRRLAISHHGRNRHAQTDLSALLLAGTVLAAAPAIGTGNDRLGLEVRRSGQLPAITRRPRRVSRRPIPASRSTTSCSRTTSITRCSARRCRPMPAPTCS